MNVSWQSEVVLEGALLSRIHVDGYESGRSILMYREIGRELSHGATKHDIDGGSSLNMKKGCGTALIYGNLK